MPSYRRKKTRREILATTAAIGAASIAGCSGSGDGGDGGGNNSGDGGNGGDGGGDNSGDGDNQNSNLIAASSGEGTVGFTVLQAHARTLQEAQTDLSLDVQARGAASMNALGSGEADMAYTNAFEFAEARDGRGRFADNPLSTKPEQLHMFYAGNLYLAARADTDIDTISDLGGFKVSISSPGVSFYSAYKSALEATGVYEDIDERRLPIGNLGDAFSNGRIDVAVVSTAANQVIAGYAQQVLERGDIDLIQITESEAEVIESEVNGLRTNTYQTKEGMLGENDPAENIAMDLPYGLAMSPNVANDIAYEYNETLVNNKDSLAEAFGLLEFWDKNAMYEICLKDYPIHPGSVEYFKDQGWWSDEYTEG